MLYVSEYTFFFDLEFAGQMGEGSGLGGWSLPLWKRKKRIFWKE